MNTVKFELTYTINGVDTVLNLKTEPKGWDKAEIVLTRDTEFFGVNYEFLDAETELSFDLSCGGEQIKYVYDIHGSDGNSVLRYYYNDEIEYEGKLNFNTYENKSGIISISLERQSIHELLSANSDKSLNILDSTTLTGNENEFSANTEIKHMYSMIIEKRATFPADLLTEADSGLVQKDYDEMQEDAGGFWAQVMLTPNSETDNISPNILSNNDINLIKITNANSAIFDSLVYDFIEIKENGDFLVNINTTLTGWCWESSIYNPELKSVPFSYKILRKRAGIYSQVFGFRDYFVYKTTVQLQPSGYLIPAAFDVFTYNEAKELKTFSENIEGCLNGDKLYFIIEFGTIDANQGRLYQNDLVNDPDTIQIIAQTSVPETDCKTITLDNSAKSLITQILEENRLNFDFSDKIYYSITNGYDLRNNSSTTQYSISFRQFMTNIKNMFGLGFNYQFEDDVEKICITPYSKLFQSREILEIQNCWDYSEQNANEYCFNAIKSGYETYSEDGTLWGKDDSLTVGEWSTPIQTNKQELSLLSSFVASSYAIETERRVQFDDTQEDSDENKTGQFDDNLFIISLDRETLEPEKYNSVSNIKSGTKTYNLRITPKRNMLNWVNYAFGCLNKKDEYEKIKNTSFVRNGKCKTLINSIWVQENETASIKRYNATPFFEPVWINFKAKLTFDQIKLIKNDFLPSYTNGEINGKYGYISVVDYSSVVKRGWLFELKYNPNTFVATFKLLKAIINNNLTGDNTYLTGDNAQLTGDQTTY